MNKRPYQAPYDEGYAEGVRVTIERCTKVLLPFVVSAIEHHIQSLDALNKALAAINELKEKP
jgi:hypothetical protein